MYKEQVVFNNPKMPVFSTRCSCELNNFHFHPELELIYVISGEMKVKSENKTYSINSDEVLFVNSSTPHSTIYKSNDFSGLLVQFRNPFSGKSHLGYLYRFFSPDCEGLYVFSGDKEKDSIKSSIEDISRINVGTDSVSQCLVASEMYKILSVLYEKNLVYSPEIKLTDNKNIERLIPVLEYIDLNYSGQISLSTLSDILSLNEYYFCRFFKKTIGCTPTDYINYVRTYYASNMLLEDKNIVDICYETGFSSLSYFNRTFKKYFMYPPSVYRKTAKNPDNLI